MIVIVLHFILVGKSHKGFLTAPEVNHRMNTSSNLAIHGGLLRR